VPLLIAAAWLAVEWLRVALGDPRGDFSNHLESGRRLLAGEFIYSGGLNVVYPPFWAMAHAPLSLLGSRAARILCFPLAGLSVGALLWILNRLSRARYPLGGEASFWCGVAAVALSSQFLARDLPLLGANTALLALAWLGWYLWSTGRPALAGVCLGLGTALKCTPLLFVAYLALKRQWRLVAVALSVAMLATLSPVLAMGTDPYRRAMSHWIAVVVRGLGDTDPSRGPLGEEKIENLSLRPALARYLMRLPYGHQGRPETSDAPLRPNDPPSPYYLQFLDLSPAQAGAVVRIVQAALVLTVACLFRKKPASPGDPLLLWEYAAVTLLPLLLSPVTWKAHAVAVLPASYLICRRALWEGKLSRWPGALLVLYAVPGVLLNRGLCGRDFIKLVDSYRLKTFGFLCLLAAVLLCWRQLRDRDRPRAAVAPGAERAGVF
jgi:alpha-1,2-mannosyltransferase